MHVAANRITLSAVNAPGSEAWLALSCILARVFVDR